MQQYVSCLKAEDCTAELRSRKMKQVNPKFILRNHLAETAIRKASDNADFDEIDRLMTLLQNPFGEQPGGESG